MENYVERNAIQLSKWHIKNFRLCFLRDEVLNND